MAVQGSSLDAAAAPAGSVLQGIPEEEEEGDDVYLLYDYDPEGQARECGPSVANTREKLRARSSSSRKTSLGSRLFPWRCAHMQCESRLWSKSALFCRAVKRPFWILVAILYVGHLSSSLSGLTSNDNTQY